eukprot:8352225-Pyramimonas_sp.AAC.1
MRSRALPSVARSIHEENLTVGWLALPMDFCPGGSRRSQGEAPGALPALPEGPPKEFHGLCHG